MSAIKGVRRKRTALMLAANLIVLGALGGMGYAGYKALRRYEGAKALTVTFIEVPATPSGMLATVDNLDRLTTVTVFVLTHDVLGEDEVATVHGAGGSIISVPVSIDSTSGVGDQRIPLTEVYATQGAEGLLAAVESTLSITFDVSMVATPAEAESLLQPIVPIEANLPADVVGSAGGIPDTLFPAGAINMTAAQAVEVITATSEDQVERDRRGNVEAVWAGVAKVIGAGRTTPEADAPIATLADLSTRLFAGPVSFRGLIADALEEADNPDEKDVERLDRADQIMVMASVAPGSMSAPAPGLVFRIEAPPGYDERVKFAVSTILFFGGNVTSVYLDGPVQEPTVYLINDPLIAEQAESTNAVFGKFEIAEPDLPTEGIQVVLQLGTDFLDGTTNTLPSTTTSTTEP